MAELTFAAVDLGAESGRVIAGKFDGQKVVLEVAHRFANTPVAAGGTLYWDTLRLWHDIQDGLGKLGAAGQKLAGIGVDTWGVDFGLLDGADQLLGNPVHYRDKRNDGMLDAAFAVVSREEIYQRTGLQFMQFNTLYQLLAMKKQDSAQLEAAKSLLFTPDLLNFWLSGEKISEYTIASTSQMLDAAKRVWDEDLLRKLGLPTQILRDIVPAGSQIGTLRAEVAARCGLAPDTQVIAPGSHDTASAVASVPWEDGTDAAYLSSGTWSLMGLELAEPLITPESYRLDFTNEGGAGNTIRFLKNIAGLWLVQECRRTWLRQGQEFNYEELTRMASEAAGSGSFVEPDDARFGSPGDMPAALREYCRQTGQEAPASVGEVVRCCLDSLALKYRWTFEKLEELRGKRLGVLHIVGGGTQNKLLAQLTADCLGRPVICGPVEATAAGNILIQAMARGEIHDGADIRAVVRRSFPVEHYAPRSDSKAAWDERYGKFLTFAR